MPSKEEVLTTYFRTKTLLTKDRNTRADKSTMERETKVFHSFIVPFV